MTAILSEYFPPDLAGLIYKDIKVRPDIMLSQVDIILRQPNNEVFILDDKGDVYSIILANVFNKAELRYKYVNRLLDNRYVQYQNGTISIAILGNGPDSFRDEMRVTDQGEVYILNKKVPGITGIITAKTDYTQLRYKHQDRKYDIGMIRKDGRVLVGNMNVSDYGRKIQFDIRTVPRFNVRSDIQHVLL